MEVSERYGRRKKDLRLERINRIPNAMIRNLCGVKEVDERIPQWISHTAKRLYKGGGVRVYEKLSSESTVKR